MAWGDNSYGKLGLGDTINRNSPTPVEALASVKQLAIRYGHVLALMNDGTVKAWGDNSSGKLAQNSSVTFNPTPTLITSLTNVKQIATGHSFSLALLNDGTVKAWGTNWSGQLGQGGSTGNVITPVQVNGLTNVQQVSATYDSSFALMSDGTVKAWGRNDYGQLGLGDFDVRRLPTTVGGLVGVKQLMTQGGQNTIVLMKDRTLTVWGWNNYGQLGLGDNEIRNTPVSVGDISSYDPTSAIQPIALGYNHSIFLLPDGTVMASGYNAYGQLGLGDYTNRYTPTAIPNLSGVKQVSAGQYHTLALMMDGTVRAWGCNNYGQLGIGSSTSYNNIPTVIPGLNEVKQVVAGYNTSFALLNNGTVMSWGDNSYGQLGLGDSSYRYIPTVINGLTAVKQIAANGHHAVFLLDDGTVKACGVNNYGQIGQGTLGGMFYTPVTVQSLSGVKQISAGNIHTLALLNNGTVKAWGSNDNGQIGKGSFGYSQGTPVIVDGLSNVKQVAAGYHHSLALMGDGTVKVWGANNFGKLGLGDTVDKGIPMTIDGLYDVKQLMTEVPHGSAALLYDNTVKAWGRNNYWQFGLGDTNDRYIPTTVSGINLINKPTTRIIAPVNNYISTAFEETIVPQIAVYDAQNDDLICEYFIDDEVIPRDAKLITDTILEKNVEFKSLDLSNLDFGKHTIKFVVSDGSENIVTSSFVIDRPSPNVADPTFIDSKTLKLTINSSLPATAKYKIASGTNYVSSSGSIVGTPDWVDLTNNQVVIKGLDAGTIYSFKAKALNSSGGETDYGTGVNVITAPAEVTASAINQDTIKVQWNPVIGATRYNIEYNGISAYTTENFHNFTNLEAGSTHKYRVRALQGRVIGQYSDYITASIKSLAPGVPTSITSTASGTAITLSWTGPTGVKVTGYDIEVDGTTISNGSSTTYKHAGLKPQTAHSYRVRAKNYHGVGPWSTIKTVLTTNGLPGIPSDITQRSNGTSITLNWSEVTDAESYEVVEVINGIDSNNIDTKGGTTFANKGLAPNSTHIYKVRGVSSIGNGPWSSSIPVTTNSMDSPENIKATKTDSTITLSWDRVTGANSYEIDVKRKAVTGHEIAVASITGVTDITKVIGELMPEAKYILSIRAINTSGVGTWSEPITVVTLPVKPAIPTNVTAAVTNTAITITWNPVASAVGYDIELDGVILENDNITSYINDDLSPYEIHNYRVRARNGGIEGDWSQLQSIRTLPGKPKAPENIEVKSTQTSATITWAAVNGATGYDIEIFDGTTTQEVERIAETSFIHRRIAANAEFTYRIRTRNIEDISEWSGDIINNSIKVTSKKNSNVDLGLTAADISDFTPYTMVVTYNSAVLTVTDLSNLTGKSELTTGKIEGTDISIKEFTPGRIVFVVDKAISPNEVWTGVINSIKFKAKANGGTTITYTVKIATQQ
jgi:alpha-tubulin suppressor-like RCC1 family protein